jgi:cytidylate kinase
MYRAVAWAALERGIDPADQDAVGALAEAVRLAVGERVTVDGVDVTEAIRGPAVNRTVSVVAANPRVRRAMVERQRHWVAERDGGVVVEGRDIGSVVLPGADVKVYLTAGHDERARRRPEEGADALSRRDHLDRTRAVSPLAVAEGAHVIDTTGRTVDDIAEEIIGWL